MIKKSALLLCCFLSFVVARAQTATDTTSPVFMFVEQMPEYPGGDQALYKFLTANLRYPDSARKNGVEGRVFVKFIVNETGAITNITVMRSSGDASLDQEAVRVVSLMPLWKPGKQNGRTVSTFYQLPLTFRVDDAKPSPAKK